MTISIKEYINNSIRVFILFLIKSFSSKGFFWFLHGVAKKRNSKLINANQIYPCKRLYLKIIFENARVPKKHVFV